MPEKLSRYLVTRVEESSRWYRVVQDLTTEVAGRLGRPNPWNGVLLTDDRFEDWWATAHPDGTLTIEERAFSLLEHRAAGGFRGSDQQTLHQAVGALTTRTAMLAGGDADLAAPNADIEQATDPELAEALSSGDPAQRLADRALARGLADSWTKQHLHEIARAVRVDALMPGEAKYWGRSESTAAADGLLEALVSRTRELGTSTAVDPLRVRLMLTEDSRRFEAVVQTLLDAHGVAQLPTPARRDLVARIRQDFMVAANTENFRAGNLRAEQAVDRLAAAAGQFAPGSGSSDELTRTHQAAMDAVPPAAVRGPGVGLAAAEPRAAGRPSPAPGVAPRTSGPTRAE